MTAFDTPADEAGRASVEVGVLLRAAGLGYLVFDYVGNSVIASLPGAPIGDDPMVAPFFARHETAIVLMAWLIVLGAVSLAVFGVTVRRCLRDSVGGDAVAALGVMTAAVLAASGAVLLAAPGERSQEQALVFWDLANGGLVAVLPAAGMVLAISLSTLRTPGGPMWIWRTGFPLAVVCLFPWIGFVSLKLFPIWIAALSVSLLRGRRWELLRR